MRVLTHCVRMGRKDLVISFWFNISSFYVIAGCYIIVQKNIVGHVCYQFGDYMIKFVLYFKLKVVEVY